jgi:hypothetical protein
MIGLIASYFCLRCLGVLRAAFTRAFNLLSVAVSFGGLESDEEDDDCHSLISGSFPLR